jgi:hypothetical protein
VTGKDEPNSPNWSTDLLSSGKRKKPTRKGVGSPYSPEVIDEFLARLVEGGSIGSVCRDPEMPSTQAVAYWLQHNPVFREKYEAARVVQADILFDNLLDIADDSAEDWTTNEDGEKRLNGEAVARSRLRIDARKWILSKLIPKKYGDKIEVNHTHKVSLSDAIAEAKARALTPTRVDHEAVDADFTTSPGSPPKLDTGYPPPPPRIGEHVADYEAMVAEEEAKVLASNHSPIGMLKGKKTLGGAPLLNAPKPKPKPAPKRHLTRAELKALWDTREEKA